MDTELILTPFQVSNAWLCRLFIKANGTGISLNRSFCWYILNLRKKAKMGGKGIVWLMFIILLILILRAALFRRYRHFFYMWRLRAIDINLQSHTWKLRMPHAEEPPSVSVVSNGYALLLVGTFPDLTCCWNVCCGAFLMGVSLSSNNYSCWCCVCLLQQK